MCIEGGAVFCILKGPNTPKYEPANQLKALSCSLGLPILELGLWSQGLLCYGTPFVELPVEIQLAPNLLSFKHQINSFLFLLPCPKSIVYIFLFGCSTEAASGLLAVWFASCLDVISKAMFCFNYGSYWAIKWTERWGTLQGLWRMYAKTHHTYSPLQDIWSAQVWGPKDCPHANSAPKHSFVFPSLINVNRWFMGKVQGVYWGC